MTVPADVLRAMFDHHRWATEKLIDHLGTLPSERLEETMPGTYGSIVSTLTHLLDADERYLQRLRDPSLAPLADRGEVPLESLRAELGEHARRWDAVLAEVEAGTLQAAIVGKDDYPDTSHAESLLLVQAIHHGNDHRTQICSTLGALGLDVPDLDGWAYWAEVRAPGSD